MYFNGDGSKWSIDQNTDIDTISNIIKQEGITNFEAIDDFPSSIFLIPKNLTILDIKDKVIIITKLDPKNFSETPNTWDMEMEYFEGIICGYSKPLEEPITKIYSSLEERNLDIPNLLK